MAKRLIKYFLDFHGLDRYDDIVREKIEEAISGVLQFHVVVIPEGESLPEQGDPQTIYLLPAEDPSQGNIYEEYLWLNDKWELIGTTRIDLSDYYTKEEINASINVIDDSINNIINDISILDVSINELFVDVSNKQDIIEDLDKIRNNALTALHSGDNITELVNNASFIDASYIQDIEYVTALHIANLHDNVSILFDRMPTKTSQLVNDSSFVTEEEIALLDLSTYAKDASLQEVELRVDTSLQKLTREILNNEYVTSSHIVSLHNDVSVLIEDISTLNSSINNIITTIPEKTSDLVNDSSFVIADELINNEYVVAMHVIEMRKDISTLKNDVSTLQEYIINLEQRIIELENGNN